MERLAAIQYAEVFLPQVVATLTVARVAQMVLLMDIHWVA
jgi:hypothetical protein